MSLLIVEGRQIDRRDAAVQLQAAYEEAIRENKEFSEVRKIYEELKFSRMASEPGKQSKKERIT